jgi:hypothetical protein
MSKLDDQLVVRMKSGQRSAIKGAADSGNMSEGAVVRTLIDMAIEGGYLEPPYIFFAQVNRVRDQNNEQGEESDR